MSTNSQPLVSVVVPMYNEAEYITECLESIIGQTYENWECVVVDNCSTDNSGEIARGYAAEHSRIRVHTHGDFLRALANHNAALRQISASSKYCKVVFADDWIFPRCLEQMVDVAEGNPSVGIVGAYGLEGQRVVWTGLQYPATMMCGREVCRRMFLDGVYVFGTATSLLYRSDLVPTRQPFFEETNLHSDMETCVALLKRHDFGFVHQVLTYSRLRETSLRTFSAEWNTYTAGMLVNLVRHGREFLSEDEFQRCMKATLLEYYENLAGGLVRYRENGFWDFHKRQLADLGLPFNRSRLAKVIFMKSVDAVLNPKRSIEKGCRIARDIVDRHRYQSEYNERSRKRALQTEQT